MATIKDLERMCKDYHYCIGCPLCYLDRCMLDRCMLYRLPKNLYDIVNKWVEKQKIKD